MCDNINVATLIKDSARQLCIRDSSRLFLVIGTLITNFQTNFLYLKNVLKFKAPLFTFLIKLKHSILLKQMSTLINFSTSLSKTISYFFDYITYYQYSGFSLQQFLRVFLFFQYCFRQAKVLLIKDMISIVCLLPTYFI